MLRPSLVAFAIASAACSSSDAAGSGTDPNGCPKTWPPPGLECRGSFECDYALSGRLMPRSTCVDYGLRAYCTGTSFVTTRLATCTPYPSRDSGRWAAADEGVDDDTLPSDDADAVVGDDSDAPLD